MTVFNVLQRLRPWERGQPGLRSLGISSHTLSGLWKASVLLLRVQRYLPTSRNIDLYLDSLGYMMQPKTTSAPCEVFPKPWILWPCTCLPSPRWNLFKRSNPGQIGHRCFSVFLLPVARSQMLAPHQLSVCLQVSDGDRVEEDSWYLQVLVHQKRISALFNCMRPFMKKSVCLWNCDDKTCVGKGHPTLCVSIQAN